MPFIGNQPALSYTSFAVQHFTTSATTSYTLDHSVANENEIRLVINNVVQQPGSSYAYTASGTTLTLSAATSATDTMYAVFLGKAVQTVTPASGSVTNAMIVDGTIAESKLASGVNTITMADQWRITVNTSNSSGEDITSNWERSDSTAYGKIGTGMTESSGIFSFPETGIYLVMVQAVVQVRTGAASAIRVHLKATTNNSTYTEVSSGETSGDTNSSSSASFNALIDVTDTSNVKIKLNTDVNNGTDCRLLADTDRTRTGITFIRLGDT